MNIEFHYYVINFLCKYAGLSESETTIISYSSQMVDTSIISYTIDTGRGFYKSLTTQNYGFWDEYFPKNVYIPFHFFPGDIEETAAVRKDGGKNPLSCTSNSKAVKELLINALRTRNPYRVGIALHTFSDSWAHQNFSGTLEDWNIIEENYIIPSIGHAQALTSPDQFSNIWTDPRLIPESSQVHNRGRFLAAAGKIYKYLCTYNQRAFDDAPAILLRLQEIVGSEGREKPMEERVLDFIIEEDIVKYDRRTWLEEALLLKDMPSDDQMFEGYSKLLWLKNAVFYRSSLIKDKPIKSKEGFFKSDFYYWNEAAREHLNTAKEILRNLL
ncbi:MAG: DUF6765 family protein [Spirochaetota bacterium]